MKKAGFFVREISEGVASGKSNSAVFRAAVKMKDRSVEIMKEETAKQFDSSPESTGKLKRSWKGGVKIKRRKPITYEISVSSSEPHARIQDKGGTITPKRVQWLTIPLTPEARRLSPRKWGRRLFLFKSKKSGKRLLAEKVGGRLRFHFVLKKHVTIKGTGYIRKAQRRIRKEARLIFSKALANVVSEAAKKAR